MIYLAKWFYSASALTLFGADVSKVVAAASVVHAQVVTLAFRHEIKGATATHTGPCGDRV